MRAQRARGGCGAFDPVTVGVVGAQDERVGVDRLAARGESSSSSPSRSTSRVLAANPAGGPLERLPGRLLGEEAEEHDAQEDVLGRVRRRVVDHLARSGTGRRGRKRGRCCRTCTGRIGSSVHGPGSPARRRSKMPGARRTRTTSRRRRPRDGHGGACRELAFGADGDAIGAARLSSDDQNTAVKCRLTLQPWATHDLRATSFARSRRRGSG